MKEDVKKTVRQKFVSVLKKIAIGFGLLVLIGVVVALQPSNSAPAPEMQWQISISNFTNAQHYDCDHYVIKDNTYFLYDTANVNTNVLTITNGYFIEARLNKD